MLNVPQDDGPNSYLIVDNPVNVIHAKTTKIEVKEQENNVGSIIKSLGFSRVLMVYGSNSIKKIFCKFSFIAKLASIII